MGQPTAWVSMWFSKIIDAQTKALTNYTFAIAFTATLHKKY